MASVKIEGKATFKDWHWGEPPDDLTKMFEAACRQGAAALLEVMQDGGSFDLAIDDDGRLNVRFYANLDQLDDLVLVGELVLLDPQVHDQDDVEKMIAGLRRAADGLQEALDKEIARKNKQ